MTRPRLNDQEANLIQAHRDRKNNQRALIIPDCHIPFEDQKAYSLMLKVGQHVQPEEIVILGDYADFYDVSSHGKDPHIAAKLLDEVEAVRGRLEELRGLFPTANIVYIEGNHENRLGRYIRDKAPELFGIVGVAGILGLDSLGIKFVHYGPNQGYKILGSSLTARHEPLAGGVHVAHNTAAKGLGSFSFGHTHRIQESQIVSFNGENFRGISNGCLIDISHKAYEYVKAHHQWALGFSVLTLVGKTWFNQLVHIIDYKCQCDGIIFGEDGE